MTYDASLLLWIMLWVVVIVLIVALMGLYKVIGRVDDLERAWWEATETINPSKTGEISTDSLGKPAGHSEIDDTAAHGGAATSAEYWSHQERDTDTDSNARLAWCECGHRRDIHHESNPFIGCGADCGCTRVYEKRLNVGATYYE